MQIRKIDQSEAKIFFDCMKSIDQETKFMMFEPGERQFDEDLIVNNLSNEKDLFLGAFSEHILLLESDVHFKDRESEKNFLIS